MFYNVGKASLAMGQRRKEIRSERAAIREEFERWKANNPYATAMDFHAKVKQLGSSTPGGSVALPDRMAIQRMAADNLRKKQEDELREQRRRQAEDLDIQVKRTAFVRQMIKDTNGQKDPEDLLSAAGMEVNTDNLKWARGLQASIVEENERNRAQRAADDAYRWTSQFNQWRSEEANRYLPDDRFPGYNYLSETGMAPQTVTAQPTPSASSGRSPSVVGDVGPIMPSPAPASAPTSAASSATSQVPVDLRLQMALNTDMQGIYQQRPGDFLGPNGLETLQQTAISVARAGGSQASDEAIIAALKDTEFYRSYEVMVDTATFKAGLSAGRPANEMAISVGDGKNAQSIKLKDILTDEVNNTGIFDNRVVPAYAVDEFAAIMRPYFVIGDDGVTMTPNITEAQLADLEAQLNSAGIYDTSQVAMQRDQILRQEKTFASVNDLLADQSAEIAEMQKAFVAEVKAAGNTLYARKQAAEQRAGQLMRFKAMTAANDPVAIYAAGGAYALDLLPASEHQAYNPVAAAALYDDAINAILEAANDPSLEVDPAEQADADLNALMQDTALQSASTAVTEADRATVSALTSQLSQPVDLRIATVSDGVMERVPMLQQGPLADVIASSEGDAFIQALKAGLIIYRDHVPGPSPMNAGNVFSAAAQGLGRVATSGEFELPRQDKAKQTFKATLANLGVPEARRDELSDLFMDEILNSLQEFETGQSQQIFGTGAMVPVTKTAVEYLTELLLPPATQISTPSDMLKASVPGARLVPSN